MEITYFLHTDPKINEIAKAHCLRNIDEVFATIQSLQCKNKEVSIGRLRTDIVKRGFEYFFECKEESKPVIAQILVRKSAEIRFLMIN